MQNETYLFYVSLEDFALHSLKFLAYLQFLCKIPCLFLGVGKNFRLLMQSCCFFFSRPFHENFKFLKNCPYDFHKILHSHSTPKGDPACAKASKSYSLDVRNIAKISPKMAKKQPFFDFFSIFSQTVHTIRTNASQKEKDLSRLLYRICGSGLLFFTRSIKYFFQC